VISTSLTENILNGTAIRHVLRSQHQTTAQKHCRTKSSRLGSVSCVTQDILVGKLLAQGRSYPHTKQGTRDLKSARQHACSTLYKMCSCGCETNLNFVRHSARCNVSIVKSAEHFGCSHRQHEIGAWIPCRAEATRNHMKESSDMIG